MPGIGIGISPMLQRSLTVFPPPAPIGTLVENDFNSANWQIEGDPQVTFVSDGIEFAPVAVALTNYIWYKNFYSALDDKKLTVTFHSNQVNPRFGFGICGVGELYNASKGLSLVIDDAGDSLVFGLGGNPTGGGVIFNSFITSFGTVTIPDDSDVTFTFRRIASNVFITKQINGGSIIPYTVDTQFYEVSGNPIDSITTLMFTNINADIKITTFKFESLQDKNVARLGVGDSLTQGYYAESNANRFFTLASIDINSGGGNTTQDVINRYPELILQNAQKYFIQIGLNDDVAGIPSATWQANLINIDNTFRGMGRQVIWITYDGWGANGIAVNSFYLSQFTGRVINTTPTMETSPGVLNPLYDSGDGDHLNGLGNTVKGGLILASPLY